MRNWLQIQSGVAALFESRILVSAHKFMDEVSRFKVLHMNKRILVSLIRRLVLSYCASSKFIWRKQLVFKEPMEPIAFPDLRYAEFLKNIQTIFPEIKIIFMVRNPIATIWSMSQRPWGYSLTIEKLRSYSLDQCIKIWKDCAQLAYDYAASGKTYVCIFERLISEPEEESRRIFNFLSIRGSHHFQPKPTKTHGFTKAEKELIHKETKELTTLILSITK